MAAALETAQDALLFASADGIIDDEEFVLLYDQTNTRKIFPYWKFEAFDINTWDDIECFTELRFNKQYIPNLIQCFGIPDRFVCQQGTVCSGLEAFCIFLKRLAYPCRYTD